MEPITVATYVEAPLEKIWHDFTAAEAVQQWNAASDDWHTAKAENDLRVGGTFNYRMEARDGSEGFDFTGVYTKVVPNEQLAYTMDDGRTVDVTFIPEGTGVRVTETFDPESENAIDLQRSGWQAILVNFKKYVEES